MHTYAHLYTVADEKETESGKRDIVLQSLRTFTWLVMLVIMLLIAYSIGLETKRQQSTPNYPDDNCRWTSAASNYKQLNA